MKTSLKRTLRTGLFRALVLLLAVAPMLTPKASAYMYPSASASSLNIVGYPLDRSSRSIISYEDSSMTRPKGKVFGTDCVTIKAAQGRAVQVRYNTPRGYQLGWIPASAMSHGDLNGGYSLQMLALKNMPVYRYENGSETLGCIASGDHVFLTAGSTDHENGRAQFLYPTSSGYKIGFVKYSDFADGLRALDGGRTIRDGLYKIYASEMHCLDGAGPNDNVHLWQDLDVPQQKVYIRWTGSAYTIQFQHNARFLDVQGASTAPGANLQTWPGNGTKAQQFHIASLGGDRFVLMSACSQLAVDCDRYQVSSNGTNLQTWFYNGQSLRLVRVDHGPISTNTSIPVTTPQHGTSQAQQAMVAAAKRHMNSTAFNGYCQKFVRTVSQEAGVPYASAGSALEACSKWRVSTSTDIPAGAAVYFRSRTPGSAGYTYGHVGIADGRGNVIHALSTVRSNSLQYLMDRYDYLGWGWQANVDLRYR